MRKAITLLLCLLVITARPKAQSGFDTDIDSVSVYAESADQDTTYAAETGEEEQPDIIGDTTLYLESISLGRDTLNRWKKEKAFSYMRNIDSLLADAKAQLEKPAERREPSGNWLSDFLSSSFLRGLLWFLAIGFVLFVIYRLFLEKGIFVRYTRGENVTVVEDDMLPTGPADYAALLAQAEEQGDYRRAVRYHFLRLLMLLSERGLIHLSPEKTNAAYVRELSPELRQSFTRLVLMYEYTWFGRRQITQETYRQIAGVFSEFNR